MEMSFLYRHALVMRWDSRRFSITRNSLMVIFWFGLGAWVGLLSFTARRRGWDFVVLGCVVRMCLEWMHAWQMCDGQPYHRPYTYTLEYQQIFKSGFESDIAQQQLKAMYEGSLLIRNPFLPRNDWTWSLKTLSMPMVCTENWNTSSFRGCYTHREEQQGLPTKQHNHAWSSIILPYYCHCVYMRSPDAVGGFVQLMSCALC